MTQFLTTGTPMNELPTGTVIFGNDIFPFTHGITGSATPITQQATFLLLNGFLAPYFISGSYSLLNGRYQPTGTTLPYAGYIQENSAQLTYITGTSYRAEAGQADVNGTLLTWTSPITRSGLSFTSGTINHVYLYDSGSGVAALEESTTVPVWSSTLNYFQKTGDATRRCIGYLQAETVNKIRLFMNNVHGRDSEFYFLELTTIVNSPIVNLGQSTGSWTSFSMSSFIPTHATEWWASGKIVFVADADDYILGISPIDLGSGNTAGFAPYTVRANASRASTRAFFGRVWLPISTSQVNFYRLTQVAGSGGSAVIECQGARIIR